MTQFDSGLKRGNRISQKASARLRKIKTFAVQAAVLSRALRRATNTFIDR